MAQWEPRRAPASDAWTRLARCLAFLSRLASLQASQRQASSQLGRHPDDRHLALPARMSIILPSDFIGPPRGAGFDSTPNIEPEERPPTRQTRVRTNR